MPSKYGFETVEEEKARLDGYRTVEQERESEFRQKVEKAAPEIEDILKDLMQARGWNAKYELVREKDAWRIQNEHAAILTVNVARLYPSSLNIDIENYVFEEEHDSNLDALCQALAKAVGNRHITHIAVNHQGAIMHNVHIHQQKEED